VRVTSVIFVSALTRRVFAAGLAAAIVKRGAEEAGAIFLTVDRLDGTVDLYGPAPQSAVESRDSDRSFLRLGERATPDEIERRLTRERRFDSDLWIVAIEDREGRPFVEVTTDMPP
jgi:hypothetical protein